MYCTPLLLPSLHSPVQIQYEITRVRQKIKDLASLHDKHMNRPTLDDSTEEEHAIEITTQEVTQVRFFRSQSEIAHLVYSLNMKHWETIFISSVWNMNKFFFSQYFLDDSFWLKKMVIPKCSIMLILIVINKKLYTETLRDNVNSFCFLTLYCWSTIGIEVQIVPCRLSVKYLYFLLFTLKNVYDTNSAQSHPYTYFY